LPPDWDEYDDIVGAATILIRGIHRRPNHKIAGRLQCDGQYRLVEYDAAYRDGYAVFICCWGRRGASREPENEMSRGKRDQQHWPEGSVRAVDVHR
jgi:hypothetical protein